MNFKSMTLKAAALAALAVAGAASFAAPSQAAIVAGDTLDISNVVGNSLVKVQGTDLSGTPIVTGLDFGSNGSAAGNFQVTGATGGFAPYLSSFGTIRDLTFVGGISGFVDNFMSINPDLLFDLKKATVTVGDLVAKQRTVSVNFFGTFTNGLGSVLGDGLFTTQLNLKNGKDLPSSYSITSEAIPTPALLPGLIGMGFAALRKRKSEESDVEAAETAKA